MTIRVGVLAGLLLAGILAALIVALGVRPASGQAPDEQVVARVVADDPATIKRLLALELDLLELRDGSSLFVLTTGGEVERLRAAGWAIAVDPAQTAALQPRSGRAFGPGYRTVDEIEGLLAQRAAAYPQLAEVLIYGQSLLRVNGGSAAGHDLLAISLTNRASGGAKPTFFLMAAIHARELTTSEVALRMIDHLLAGYGSDADITWLLDEHRLVVVPVANPDGREIAEQGYYQRKNLRTPIGNICSTTPSGPSSSHRGVDLNRNSTFLWGTIDSPAQSPCSSTYPGTAPASEPETAALEGLMRELFADQRGELLTDTAPLSTTGIMVTLHSYGDLVLWPWGHAPTPAPNEPGLRKIGQEMARASGYYADQASYLYPTSGATDDWAYAELGIAAFTFELGPDSGPCAGFMPPFSCLDGEPGGDIWARNLPGLLYALRVSPAPYALAEGPAPAAPVAGAGATITATFDERDHGGQAIAAAEVYVGLPPSRGGQPQPMVASDGAFDETVEAASATLRSPSGRQPAWVRARDAAGNWGPLRATWVGPLHATYVPVAQTP